MSSQGSSSHQQIPSFLASAVPISIIQAPTSHIVQTFPDYTNVSLHQPGFVATWTFPHIRDPHVSAAVMERIQNTSATSSATGTSGDTVSSPSISVPLRLSHSVVRAASAGSPHLNVMPQSPSIPTTSVGPDSNETNQQPVTSSSSSSATFSFTPVGSNRFLPTSSAAAAFPDVYPYPMTWECLRGGRDHHSDGNNGSSSSSSPVLSHSASNAAGRSTAASGQHSLSGGIVSQPPPPPPPPNVNPFSSRQRPSVIQMSPALPVQPSWITFASADRSSPSSPSNSSQYTGSAGINFLDHLPDVLHPVDLFQRSQQRAVQNYMRNRNRVPSVQMLAETADGSDNNMDVNSEAPSTSGSAASSSTNSRPAGDTPPMRPTRDLRSRQLFWGLSGQHPPHVASRTPQVLRSYPARYDEAPGSPSDPRLRAMGFRPDSSSSINVSTPPSSTASTSSSSSSPSVLPPHHGSIQRRHPLLCGPPVHHLPPVAHHNNVITSHYYPFMSVPPASSSSSSSSVEIDLTPQQQSDSAAGRTSNFEAVSQRQAVRAAALPYHRPVPPPPSRIRMLPVVHPRDFETLSHTQLEEFMRDNGLRTGAAAPSSSSSSGEQQHVTVGNEQLPVDQPFRNRWLGGGRTPHQQTLDDQRSNAETRRRLVYIPQNHQPGLVNPYDNAGRMGLLHFMDAGAIFMHTNGEPRLILEDDVKEAIDKDTKAYRYNNQFPKNEECIICFEEFELDQEYRVLSCNQTHRFHKHCIDRWLIKNKPNCPICRQILPTLNPPKDTVNAMAVPGMDPLVAGPSQPPSLIVDFPHMY